MLFICAVCLRFDGSFIESSVQTKYEHNSPPHPRGRGKFIKSVKEKDEVV